MWVNARVIAWSITSSCHEDGISCRHGVNHLENCDALKVIFSSNNFCFSELDTFLYFLQVIKTTCVGLEETPFEKAWAFFIRFTLYFSCNAFSMMTFCTKSRFLFQATNLHNHSLGIMGILESDPTFPHVFINVWHFWPGDILVTFSKTFIAIHFQVILLFILFNQVWPRFWPG